MTSDIRYSANDIARILNEEGDQEISTRTVNYYAFEKIMFDVKEQGKNCFTDEELDKVRSIRLLKQHTNYTLEQIKKIINQYPLEEIKKLCMERALKISAEYVPKPLSQSSSNLNAPKARTIRVNDDFTLVVTHKVSTEKLRKIIDFINSL